MDKELENEKWRELLDAVCKKIVKENSVDALLELRNELNYLIKLENYFDRDLEEEGLRLRGGDKMINDD